MPCRMRSLLPNDGLIPASCSLYDMDAIASFDEDFKISCKKESILLATGIADLNK